MTRHAREAISLAGATSLAELVLVVLMITDWSAGAAIAVTFLFLIGPPLFLAVTVWRRRTHAEWTRVLFGATIAVALGGLGVLGFDLYRYQTDARFRLTPNMHGIYVPVGQWVVVLAVWLWLVIQEGREKRAAKAQQQARQS